MQNLQPIINEQNGSLDEDKQSVEMNMTMTEKKDVKLPPKKVKFKSNNALNWPVDVTQRQERHTKDSVLMSYFKDRAKP